MPTVAPLDLDGHCLAAVFLGDVPVFGLASGEVVRLDHGAQRHELHDGLLCMARSPDGTSLLTGGEAFHDHHHDEPVSALHLPRKGFWNRIFDYNGTFLLICEKLKWAQDLKYPPMFENVKKLPA